MVIEIKHYILDEYIKKKKIYKNCILMKSEHNWKKSQTISKNSINGKFN